MFKVTTASPSLEASVAPETKRFPVPTHIHTPKPPAVHPDLRLYSRSPIWPGATC